MNLVAFGTEIRTSWDCLYCRDEKFSKLDSLSRYFGRVWPEEQGRRLAQRLDEVGSGVLSSGSVKLKWLITAVVLSLSQICRQKF